MTRNAAVSAPPAGSRPRDPQSTRPPRTRTKKVVRTGFATGCLIVGVGAVLLSLFMYDYNFLLMMPLAITGIVCGILARRAGAPRLLAYPLILVSLVPVVIATPILLGLLANMPHLELHGIEWIEE